MMDPVDNQVGFMLSSSVGPKFNGVLYPPKYLKWAKIENK